MPKPQRAEAKIATPRPARKTRAATSAVGAWGEREAGILAVAEDLFLRNGYENTSMAAVAAAAGLSEGTLYNYFRNKNDLVIRSGLAVLERRVEAAQQAVREAGSLREGLERLIGLHLSAIIEDDEKYRIWLREVRGVKSYRRSAGRDALARFANQFVALLDKFGHGQERASGPTRTMMRDMVFGGSEHIGFTAMIQKRADRIDVEATAKILADVYLRGFGLE
ncbi:MAG: helix-turn-helix transcriptional regulator [Methylobacteriaceae bacterium]|nr:helix-turn-helix transcriptional regulator [Rhodoblastus sp.]MCC0006239.1 helix-turn-helix transcriptional regulator [Methylobacteriaceae bacterium]